MKFRLQIMTSATTCHFGEIYITEWTILSNSILRMLFSEFTLAECDTIKYILSQDSRRCKRHFIRIFLTTFKTMFISAGVVFFIYDE